GDCRARLAEGVGRLAMELTPVGAALAVIGAAALWRQERSTLVYLASLAGLTVFFRAGYPAEGNVVYLLPALFALALLAGIGTARALSHLGETAGGPAVALAGLGLAAMVAGRAGATAPRGDASGARAAAGFGRRALSRRP